ncbi:MAG: family 78 glycoside hydrolase catalytic domain [Propionicimonas sp.]
MVATAERLLCDYAPRPLGVSEPPWLSWILTAGAEPVTGARVVVRQPDGEVVWNSGWVAGSPCGMRYGGTLRSRTEYVWSVQLRGTGGRVCSVASSCFETGLLAEDDWSASWIRQGDGERRYAEPPSDDGRSLAVRYLDPPPYFRREFQVDGLVARARLYVTARGIYEVLLNGREASDHRLAPGWTDYSDRIEYQSLDVTALLTRGSNAIGGFVAPGWWSGYVGFDRRRQAEHYGTQPELLAQLEIDYADGRRQLVVTDSEWTATDGPIRYADLLMGQLVDDRAELGDWATAGGADGEWRAVQVSPRDGTELSSLGRVPIRVCERLPGEVVVSTGGAVLVDFHQNLVGNIRLDVSRLRRGQSVRIRHGEAMADGELYTANLRTAEATDSYVADGRHSHFEPKFTSHGFRYVELTGDVAALGAIRIEALSVRSDNREVGTLSFANPALQQLESNIRWGQRSNFVSVPTDCPQRDERLGWLADAQVFLPTAAYNADVAAFFRNWLRDVRYAQDADGAFPDVAPRLRLPQQGAPAWGDGGVMIPWELYRWYADPRFLTDAWESIVAWVDHIERHNPSLIWRHAVGLHYGDWLNPGEVTDRDLLATAYFAHSARIAQRVGEILGERDAALRFGQLADRIGEAFRREFIAADGTITGDTQTGYLLTLAFDLATPAQRPAVEAALVRAVERRGPALTTGFLGVGRLLPVLTDLGRPDLAWELALRRDYPSWLYSVDRGATTIWERWDGWTEEGGFQSAEMNSFNHYSLGSIGEWFYGHAAGIRQHPDSIGWTALEMAPAFSRRAGAVSASFDSPRGRIVSGWSFQPDGLHWELELPAGTTARIAVPAASLDDVTESGRPLVEHPGVRAVRGTGSLVSAELESGRYRLVSSSPDREGG